MCNASIAGVWRTDGHSTVLSIQDGQLRTYDTTAISCISGRLSAEQSGPAGPDGAVRFSVEGIPELIIRPGRELDAARLHVDGDVGDVLLHRLAVMPAGCARPVLDDPQTVFEVFWHTYAENYPFFAAKGIDWKAVGDRYRLMVGSHTTDEQLFTILTDMIMPLGDAHTAIVVKPGQFYAGRRPGTPNPTQDLIDRVTAIIAHRLPGPLQTWAKGNIGYADLPDRLGYLRILSFSRYAEDEEGFAAQVAELDRALDAIFTPSRTSGPDALRGIIVDLRINGGGSDALGLQVASRLTTRPYLAYAKQARNDPGDPTRFTPAQPIQVSAASAPSYPGPLVILTGSLTISAGETFIQALLARSPAPIRIGENTQGVFSDVLERKLPNSWSYFTLPNERYLTQTGETFDGLGIPPDIREPVFTEEELTHNRDSAFDRALAELSVR